MHINNIIDLKDIVNTPGSEEIVQIQATTFILRDFALDYIHILDKQSTTPGSSTKVNTSLIK